MNSRRKILAAIGTTTGIALTGCVGNSTDEPDTDDTNTDDTGTDDTGTDEPEGPSAQECANAVEILSVDDSEEPHPISFTLQNTLDVEARYTMTVKFMTDGLRDLDTVTERGTIGGGLNEVVTFSTTETGPFTDVHYWDGPEDYGNTHPGGDGNLESECVDGGVESTESEEEVEDVEEDDIKILENPDGRTLIYVCDRQDEINGMIFNVENNTDENIEVEWEFVIAEREAGDRYNELESQTHELAIPPGNSEGNIPFDEYYGSICDGYASYRLIIRGEGDVIEKEDWESEI